MGKKYTADTFEGTASGNVAKTGGTMTGNLTISKSDAMLSVIDTDTSNGKAMIKMQARDVMSSYPVYLTSDDNQDFAIRKNSSSSTSYADTTVGSLSSITNTYSANNLEIQNNSTSWSGGSSDPMSKIRMFKADTYPNASGYEASLELYENSGFGNNTKRGKLIIKTGDVEHIEMKNTPLDGSGSSSFTYLKTPTVFTYAIQSTNGIRLGGTASANEFDDYEEGSYNVQFRAGSTNYGSSNWVSGGGIVWTDNSQYIKVGRKVTLFFDLQYKGIPTAIATYTGELWLTNLPFTMAHGGGGNISFSWYNRNNSSENPQNFGGATRLTPHASNQASLIKLEYTEYSSYWSDWSIGSMKTNYLPTAPPGGNMAMFGQFTYFTDN
jgi:hypothetical protein